MTYTSKSEGSRAPQGGACGSRRPAQVPLLRPHASTRMGLQRTLGNQGVLRRMESGVRINDVNDPAEKEADRAAEAVMQPAEATAAQAVAIQTRSSPALDRKCAHCAEEESELQRKETSAAQPGVAPPSVHQVLKSAGQPLESGTRTFMERRFGQDFSDVRVHADSAASSSARDVKAVAYTVGRDVVFDTARYDPQRPSSRRLLAHELTHVLQQRAGAERRVQRSLAGCEELIKDGALATFLARQGDVIHNILKAHFRSTVSGAFRTLYIPGASASPLRTQGLCGKDSTVIDPQIIGGEAGAGKPDLARRTESGILQVAEIKPAAIECLIDGEKQLFGYVQQGLARDKAIRAWKLALGITAVAPMPEKEYQPPVLNIVLPGVGIIEVRTAWCAPGLLAYSVRRQRLPDRVPVTGSEKKRQRQPARGRVPQSQQQAIPGTFAPSTYELIKQFVESVVASGVNADRAAGKFLQDHPEIGGAIILAGVGVIIALLADDITLVGILDDAAIPPILLALYRAAQTLQAAPAR